MVRPHLLTSVRSLPAFHGEMMWSCTTVDHFRSAVGVLDPLAHFRWHFSSANVRTQGVGSTDGTEVPPPSEGNSGITGIEVSRFYDVRLRAQSPLYISRFVLRWALAWTTFTDGAHQHGSSLDTQLFTY
jgi:hypothetical protein